MFRQKKYWMIGLAIVALAAVAATLYTTSITQVEAAESAAETVQTAVVRRGSITISATGAGAIIPAEEVALSFGSSGTLAELFVRVGDKVAPGDALARIDDTAVQEALANAQLQLTKALMQTDGSATAVGVSYDDISVEQAQINLEQAQNALDDLRNWQPDADTVAQAEASLAAAQASYNAALGNESANAASLTVNRINLEQAQRDLADAQEAYNVAYDPGRDWELNDPRHADALERERDAATNAVQRAQDSLTIAEANYNAAVSSSNASSSTNAQSGLLNAQFALTAAQTGPTDDDIAAAQVAVRQAELALNQALLNRESNQLDLAQAQMSVAAAEADLAAATLTAPMAGTVTAVNAAVGETVSAGVITLADLSQPLLEIYLDESDLDKVGVGFAVDVVFDALPDDTFSGTIIQIDPQLSTSSGVTALRALVQLNANAFAKPQTLPIGLNATVEVIGGQTSNALLVPVEALREISSGQYALFVMENDEPQLRMVEVGLMDFTFAEIISGVAEGDVVTTGILETE